MHSFQLSHTQEEEDTPENKKQLSHTEAWGNAQFALQQESLACSLSATIAESSNLYTEAISSRTEINDVPMVEEGRMQTASLILLVVSPVLLALKLLAMLRTHRV